MISSIAYMYGWQNGLKNQLKKKTLTKQTRFVRISVTSTIKTFMCI